VRLRRVGRFFQLFLIASLAASSAARGQVDAPLDRPEFPIPRYAALAADTVRTAVGTIPHESDSIRWSRRAMPFTVPGLSCGVTASDIDGDGDVDLFVARRTRLRPRNGEALLPRGPQGEVLTPSQLYRNDGAGGWTVVDSPALNIGITRHRWGDVDADGDADLLVQGDVDGSLERIHLVRQDPGAFVRWELDAAVRERLASARAMALGDRDGDGFLDVLIADPAFGLTVVYGPDLRRVDEVAIDGLPGSLALHVVGDDVVAHDVHAHWDRSDFALAVDRGGRTRRLDGPLGHPLFEHVSRADIDGDGRRDFFFGQSDYFGGRNALVMGTAEGGWRLVEEGTGLFAGYRYTAGMIWGDVDQDGRLDGVQSRYAGSALAVRSPVFRQLEPRDGTPRFGMLVGEAAPEADGASRAAVFFDANDDGDLDLFVTRTIDYGIRGSWESTRDLFFENVSDGGHWLQVDLDATRVAVGARVEVETGTRVLSRSVGDGGVPGMSGLPARLHFGLGEATRVRVTVTWPSGRREDFGPVDADQRVRFTESPDGR